jgi:hypothetical protein
MTEELSTRDRIGVLAAGYAKTRDPLCLEEMKQILEDIDNDLTMAPPANSALRAFANLGNPESGPYTLAEAQKVITEMRIEYPDFEPNGWHVFALGQSVQQAGLFVPYKTLQYFIQEGVYLIQRAVDSGDLGDGLFNEEPLFDDTQIKALKSIANKAKDTVARFDSYANTPTGSTNDEDLQLSTAVKEKLKEVLNMNKEFIDMLQSTTSEHTPKTTLQDMWTVFSESPTTDCVRLTFAAMFKLVVEETRNGAKNMITVVEQVVDLLEKAGV